MIQTEPKLSDAELANRAMSLLMREFGPKDAIRFIHFLKPGSGDYTKEREELFKDVTLEQLIADIHAHRQVNSRASEFKPVVEHA
jgi:hypothetical protein